MAPPSPDLRALNPASKEYLEAVFELGEEGQRILQARIGERLGLTPATVSEGIRRLVHEGYVTIDSRDVIIENLREQQRALGRVLRAVARSEGVRPVFEAIVEEANRICDGDYSALYVAEGGLFRVSVYSGAGSEAQLEYELTHPHTRDRTTLVGRVALTREPVHIPDALADADYSWEGQRIAGYRSLVGVPVLVDDDLFGVIGTVRTTPAPFTDDQIQFLRAFADQAAIAIVNARLLAAGARHARQGRAHDSSRERRYYGSAKRQRIERRGRRRPQGLPRAFAVHLEPRARLAISSLRRQHDR